MIGRTTELAVPATAMLVRVRVVDDQWPERLPIVPPGHLVSATVSSASMARRWPDLEARGYRFAGEVAAPVTLPGERGDVVDVVVDAALIEADPAWWQALSRAASHTFPLAFGPVLHVFDDVLARHHTVWSLLHAR